MDKKVRKSPSKSATEYEEGSIEFGNDKNRWVVKATKTGIKRWIPFANCSLFGYKPLTIDYLENNIGIPITVFERQSPYMFPKKSKDFDVKYKFIASGHATLNGKFYENWLKTRKPIIKKKDMLIIDGVMKSKDINSTIHASHIPNELVSTNLMNTDAYIKE
jgi:hypothetical protein